MKIDIETVIKENLSIVVVVMVLPVLLIMIIFSVKGFASTKNDVEQLQTEIGQLKAKDSILKANQILTSGQIDEYNSLLTKLVPDKEDFFSIITALENLSQETGFNIVEYSISVADSTPNKLSLSVKGDGNSESFIKLLQEYTFSSGRLITIDKLQFTSDDMGKIGLAFNFYNKKVSPVSDDKVIEINQSDISLMEKIKNKVTLDLIPQDQEVINTDYKTTDNPF